MTLDKLDVYHTYYVTNKKWDKFENLLKRISWDRTPKVFSTVPRTGLLPTEKIVKNQSFNSLYSCKKMFPKKEK